MCIMRQFAFRNGSLVGGQGWILEVRKELEIQVLLQVTESSLTCGAATQGLKGSW